MTTLLVTLLNGLWQGIAIAAITWGALRLSQNVNASTRYAAWTLALFATVVFPIVTSVGRVSFEAPKPYSTIASTAVVPQHVREPRERMSAPERNPARPAPGSILGGPALRVAVPAALIDAVFVLWALAACALLVRLAAALVTLERLKRDALPLGMEYRDMLKQFQEHSGRTRDVRICSTGGIQVPVAVGLFDAMVLLPQHLLDTLDPSEIDQISLHELSHLLRHDDWTNAFERLISALLFFNPAVWFIARQMDIEREVACDDYVLQLTGAVRNYAYCLTKMAEMTSWPHQPLAAPGVFVTRKSISIRIERLLRTGRAISSSISPATALTVVAGLCAAYFGAHLFTPAVAFAQAQPVKIPQVKISARDTKASPVHLRVKAIHTPPKHVYVDVTPHPAAIPKAAHVPARTPGINIAQQTIDVPGARVVIPAIHIPSSEISQAGQRSASNHGGACSGCNFRGAQLAGKDFSHQNVSGSDFSGANLRGARFNGSDATGTTFHDADLTDASFAGAVLTGADFEGARLDGTRFAGAKLMGVAVSVRRLAPRQAAVFLRTCIGCDFAGVNVSGQDLHGLVLIGADLSHADLRNTDLSGASFTGVDLSHAVLSGANLHGATFTRCDLRKTDLRHVDFSAAIWDGSSFNDAITQ